MSVTGGKTIAATIFEKMHDVFLGKDETEFVYVLSVPKYKGGYGCLVYDPTNFKNESSIHFS